MSDPPSPDSISNIPSDDPARFFFFIGVGVGGGTIIRPTQPKKPTRLGGDGGGDSDDAPRSPLRRGDLPRGDRDLGGGGRWRGGGKICLASPLPFAPDPGAPPPPLQSFRGASAFVPPPPSPLAALPRLDARASFPDHALNDGGPLSYDGGPLSYDGGPPLSDDGGPSIDSACIALSGGGVRDTTSSSNPVLASISRAKTCVALSPRTISAVVKTTHPSMRCPPTTFPSKSAMETCRCAPFAESVPVRETISKRSSRLTTSFFPSRALFASRSVTALREPTQVSTKLARSLREAAYAQRAFFKSSPGGEPERVHLHDASRAEDPRRRFD